MAAKKAPMKKMAAPAKTAPKKMSASAKPMMTEAQIRKEIYRKYGLTDKSVVSQRRSSDPGKTGPISRKEYMQSFDDVVAESSLGTGSKVSKVAMQIAGERWDRTFGPGKRTSADNIASAYGRGVRPKKK
jgi:hypothetical protein